MATLPAASEFTGAGVTEGDFKGAMTTLRTFLNDLLSGDSSNKPGARSALQTPLNSSVAKTGAYTAVAADSGKVLICTGTFAVTMTSAITLGDGWTVAVANVGTGVITLDTSLSQLIDGGASITVEAGTGKLIHCTGSQFTSIGGSSSTIDFVARDQIAVTNLRLMLNSAVTTGALVQGRQWELSTDEWAATSTSETYVAGTPNYYSNPVAEYTPTGSTFGDMTANGGLAAAFDGSTSQDSSVCAFRTSVTSAYCGKAFAGARNIGRVDTYGSNNAGYIGGTNASLTITIYGKSSAPANATDGTSIGSTTFTDGDAVQLKQITCDSTTAYQYVWATITTGAPKGLYFAEIKYFDAPPDMTLIPPASVSVATDPIYMDAFFLYKDDSTTAVLGTDLTVELSRDGGTTYSTAALENMGAYDATYFLIKARGDVSAQPGGTSMSCRIKALNKKAQRVAAPALYSE